MKYQDNERYGEGQDILLNPGFKQTVLSLAILSTVPQILLYAWIYASNGFVISASALGVLGVVSLISGCTAFLRPDFGFHVGFVEFLFIMVCNAVAVHYLGGLSDSGGQALWMILAPIGALLLFGPRKALWWFGLLAALLVLLFFIPKHVPVKSLSEGVKDMLALFNLLLPACVIFSCLYFFEMQKRGLFALFQREHDRAEELLLQMLPRSVADRLKQGRDPIADNFADVTVLFADLCGFSDLAPKLSPRELVGLLNAVFSDFDMLAEKYGVEKIKTIGDAYMVVGGLAHDSEGHVEAIADLALEMAQAVSKHSMEGLEPLSVRIGINTGPVIAGVIGHKRFVYDLWGDTVNLASRMESRGRTGQIQVSHATFQRLYRKYELEERGPVSVGANREERAYILKSRRL